MLPVKTEHSNHNFGPPEGKEDEIGNLPCQVVENADGSKTIFSVWKPNQAERDAIARGQNIRLGVDWIGGFPPISLGVTFEEVISTLTTNSPS